MTPVLQWHTTFCWSVSTQWTHVGILSCLSIILHSRSKDWLLLFSGVSKLDCTRLVLVPVIIWTMKRLKWNQTILFSIPLILIKEMKLFYFTIPHKIIYYSLQSRCFQKRHYRLSLFSLEASSVYIQFYVSMKKGKESLT